MIISLCLSKCKLILSRNLKKITSLSLIFTGLITWLLPIVHCANISKHQSGQLYAFFCNERSINHLSDNCNLTLNTMEHKNIKPFRLLCIILVPILLEEGSCHGEHAEDIHQILHRMDGCIYKEGWVYFHFNIGD